MTCSGQELKVDFRRSSELEMLELIRTGVLGEHPDEAALKRVANLDIDELTAAAAQIRDKRADGNVITFSPKVFIPLTRVCRDFCGYCTFAMGPKAGQPVYMSIGEVALSWLQKVRRERRKRSLSHCYGKRKKADAQSALNLNFKRCLSGIVLHKHSRCNA